MFETTRLFSDAYMREEEGGLTFVYRGGMVSYVEALRGGSLHALDWNGAGFSPHSTTIPAIPQVRLGDYADRSFAFNLVVDGQRLHSHWRCDGFDVEERGSGIVTTLKLVHGVRPVEVLVRTQLDGTSVLTRWLEITNAGERDAAVSEISVMSGALGTTPRWRNHLRADSALWRLGYMEDHRWGYEGDFRWHDVRSGGQYITSRYGRERYRHPMFLLENRATGETFIGQFGYSGGYKFDFDLDDCGDSAHLCFAAGVAGYAPLRVLAPGETTVTPAMHIGMVYGGLDPAVNEMNRHIRHSVMTFGRGDVRIAPMETGIGPEMDMGTKEILSQIDAAAARGSDVFFLDASWYCPPDKTENDWLYYVGDWFPETERYDMTMAEIRDYCKGKGLKFGLWMEPERLGRDSRILKEHPEYCTYGYDDQIKGGVGGGGGMLDVSREDAAAWIEGQLIKFVDHYGLDMLRIDYNVGNWCSRAYVPRGEYMENSEYRYYENWYRILDTLRRTYPKLILENCASGGGRTDLGMLARVSHTWATDWQLAPRSFMITNGLTMCMPPAYLDRLAGGQNNHTVAEFDFQTRQLLFGRPSVGLLNPDLICCANPLQKDRATHIIELYNNVVRPMHATGSRVYHHTPDLGGNDPQGTGILELTSSDGGSAILGVFRLSDPDEAQTTVLFRGLDISKRYRLTMDNSGASAVISGYKLMNKGVTVNLPGALSSELLIAVEED